MGDLEEHLAQCGWISLRLKASLSKAEFTIENEIDKSRNALQ